MTTPKNDCRSLFQSNNTSKDTYHKQLAPPSKDIKLLTDARVEIRKAIRDGFSYLKEHERIEALQNLSMPRFAPQGSFVYGTMNNPAYPPDQQLDIDYGIYLPFTELGDGYQPKQAAKAYFHVIETILEKHIRQHRPKEWTLKSKDNCIRVILASHAHIDLPLYGCPESELSRIVEAANIKLANSKATATHHLDFYDFHDRVDSKYIHLAHRTKGWLPSDPLVISDWVDRQSKIHGSNNNLKTVCKYLKGWRDEVVQWKIEGGPSSLLLLALTIDLYSTEADGVHAQLAEVINGLCDRISYPVTVPVPGQENDEEDLLSRLSQENRKELRGEFRSLEQRYNQAMQIDDVEVSNRILRNIFGPRFPHRPHDIKQNDNADEVRKTPAVVTPAPIPKTTTSG